MHIIAIKPVYNPSLESLLFSIDNTTPLHHQSHLDNVLPARHPNPTFTTMVSRPAAEGTMPISGLSRAHVNDRPLCDSQEDLGSGSSGIHVNDQPLRESQAELESGSSGTHVNDQPLREAQADLEAGRVDQEKAEPASTASSPPPPAYFSSISSHIEPSAKT
jgi:hypothetical protein